MIPQDLFLILRWWILLSLAGVIFLPVTFQVFKKFFDSGYAFSKIIGILIISYLVWLAGSLKILPFSTASCWLTLAVGAAGNLHLFLRNRQEIRTAVKKMWKVLLFEEILFLVCLVFWSLVRGFQPEIHGLEKFMDYGFLNSVLRSNYFPPKDIWLSGKTINYYYFGHLVAAVLTKFSGLDSAITYNLMIATIFSLSFTAAFSLGANLIFAALNKLKTKRRLKLAIFGGALSTALLNLGGNLHPLWYFLTKKTFSGYWYPDATRFIVQKFGAADNTIHEFPIYSFVVADLHGHFSNLPFVLLFLALLLTFIASANSDSRYPKSKRPLGFGFRILGACPPFWRDIRTLAFDIFKSHISSSGPLLHLLLPSLALGVMLMTNPWDFPIYFMLLGIILLRVNIQKTGWGPETLGKTFLAALPYGLLSILFSLPFHLNFQQIAQGIALVNARSPFWQLLVLWGFFWTASLTFLILNFKRKIKQQFKPENLIRGLARLFNLKVKISKKTLAMPLRSPIDSFVLIFIGVATLLIIIPEIIYVKDIYIASHHRANTMFKLTYQAFLLYALSTGYIVTRVLLENYKYLRSKLPLFTLYLLLFASAMIYPYFAIRSYYGLKNYQGLNGLAWSEPRYPGDHAGILWLKENVKEQPVILEAVGESYTDFARVSANTGLPTVLGWPVHEWLWRGSYDEPGKRREEVGKIYESVNLTEVKQLLEKYQVRYIFVGSLERKQYQSLNEEKFGELAEPVFQSGKTTIYKLQ